MRNPNPRNYDLLWQVGNFGYLLTSLYLNSEHKRRDYIITYHGNTNRDYLAKSSRRRLSKQGLFLVGQGFPSFRKKLRQTIRMTHRRFGNERVVKLRMLTDKQLAARFSAFAEFSRKFWQVYFWTEYFCYDKVNQYIIEGSSAQKKQLGDRIQQIQQLKFRMREQLQQTIFTGGIAIRYIEEIQRRLNLSSVDSYHYRELIDGLRTGDLPRVKRDVYVLGKFNHWQLITGKPARTLINSFERVHLYHPSRQLVGQTAFPGRYRGRVRIIPFSVVASPHQLIKKMKRGEVLVTGTTGPEMILACKKAGAIITEEGGITSHAAIVSRELGIPCIIGTKIATQVLKDGDRVEVDANKGIVKKI